MPQEPAYSSVPRQRWRPGLNPYEGRWRWWYSAISDWMIRHPGGKLQDCAKFLNKGVMTISYIVNTDLFKEFHARRKEEWRQQHDFALREKLTGVAVSSLDILAEQMKKKGDQIPMKLVTDVALGALDRLGYSPQSAQVSVNVDARDQSTNQSVVLNGVSASELEEARQAMRRAEEVHRGTAQVPLLEYDMPTEGCVSSGAETRASPVGTSTDDLFAALESEPQRGAESPTEGS